MRNIHRPSPDSGLPSPGPKLVWPLPALLAWALAWALFLGLHARGISPAWSVSSATALGLCGALMVRAPWRRLLIVAGFPASLAASGLGQSFPAWIWLVPLGLLALLYPMNVWRDAPLFPTPEGILEGLPRLAPLPHGARILDAGSGLGAGLAELHRVYPECDLTGLEWSWPLRLLCGRRAPFATVRRDDIWQADWSGYDLVYMFQRPESMGPAAEKARRELRPGSWLVSLEFEATDLKPAAVLRNRQGKPVWVYRMK